VSAWRRSPMSRHTKRTKTFAVVGAPSTMQHARPPVTLNVAPIGASLSAEYRQTSSTPYRANVIDMSSGPLFAASPPMTMGPGALRSSLANGYAERDEEAAPPGGASAITVAEMTLLIVRFLVQHGLQQSADVLQKEARGLLAKAAAMRIDPTRSLSSLVDEYAGLREKETQRQRFVQRFDNDDNLVLVLGGLFDLIEAAQQRLAPHGRLPSHVLAERRSSREPPPVPHGLHGASFPAVHAGALASHHHQLPPPPPAAAGPYSTAQPHHQQRHLPSSTQSKTKTHPSLVSAAHHRSSAGARATSIPPASERVDAFRSAHEPVGDPYPSSFPTPRFPDRHRPRKCSTRISVETVDRQ
jgi:hypothetical protein